MTSPAPAHKVIHLFNGLLKRAQESKSCLSLQSMALAYDFDDPIQAQNALDRLVQSGHIRIDIGGKYPALRIVKDHYKALHECRAKVLSPAKIEAGQARPVAAVSTTVSTKRVVTAAPEPAIHDIEAAPVVQKATATPLSHLPPLQAKKRSRSVSFHVSPEDHGWLHEHFPASGASSVAAFARDIFNAELNRRQTEPAGKFRVSAAVIRAARDAGQPLDQFVTDLIELGLRARKAEGVRP